MLQALGQSVSADESLHSETLSLQSVSREEVSPEAHAPSSSTATALGADDN